MTAEINHELGIVFDNSEYVSSREVNRVIYLRPSQLPFCPLRFWLAISTEGLTRKSDFYSQFYTSVGTTVHEVIQSHLHRSKRFISNWHCRICGKTRYFTTSKKCCGAVPDYREVEINTKGMSGHIDAIFRDRKSRYWIVDFKTSSVASLAAKKRDPGAAYKEQIGTYAMAVSKKYDIRIHGVCLVFIGRDNPRKRTTWWMEFTDDANRRTKLGVANYIKQHKEALRLSTFKELKKLHLTRRCKTSEDVKGFVGNCQYSALCTSPFDQKPLLKDIFDSAHFIPIESLKWKKE